MVSINWSFVPAAILATRTTEKMMAISNTPLIMANMRRRPRLFGLCEDGLSCFQPNAESVCPLAERGSELGVPPRLTLLLTSMRPTPSTETITTDCPVYIRQKQSLRIASCMVGATLAVALGPAVYGRGDP